ncbi:MAG: hypothetical protein A2481_00965 [Candidatus Yonathbacteria bacterium RIFOXYC2_FULL_47_9]|nr:MAG: hypothetical protein A2481_00965 [Candidatus Yonathbacteria bacterium RIFOXYC2_FULL_47_9]HAT68764.1 hypothetical protein [Candidatus Yonathbacteria bacterium]
MPFSVYNKRSVEALWFFVVFYVTFGIFLTVVQEWVVYQPATREFAQCADLSRTEKIPHEGTRMYFKDNGPRVVVLYHGNFGSACDRAFLAELFEQAGYSYLLPEYAGYSNDTVSPTHTLLKKDVEHTVDFLRTKNFSEVVVVGESIGVGFAAYHTALLPPQKLLLFSSFKNLSSIARVHYWYYPVSLLVKDPFDNVALIGNFQGEILALHGEQDDIIPLALGQKFFTELDAPHKEMVVIPGLGHNDLFASPDMYQVVRGFLK